MVLLYMASPQSTPISENITSSSNVYHTQHTYHIYSQNGTYSQPHKTKPFWLTSVLTCYVVECFTYNNTELLMNHIAVVATYYREGGSNSII